MSKDTESFLGAMSGNSRFIVRLFADFISLPCEHEIPCRSCKECWVKICEELHKENHIDECSGMAVRL
jgi:hypothetical protein